MRGILFPAALLAALLLACGAAGARADTQNNAPERQERLEFADPPETCSVCGSAKVAPILYGMPNFTDELERALAEGKLALGGCVITDDDPSWKCLSCGAVFYDKNKSINNHAQDAPNLQKP